MGGVNSRIDQAIADLKENKKTELDLMGNILPPWIGPEQIKKIAPALSTNNSVRKLSFYYNQIKPEGSKYLSEAIMNNVTITDLNLKKNDIGALGCKYLSEVLKNNRTITDISLADNDIGALGCQYISEALKKNSSITHINLAVNFIGNEGCRFLSEALSLNTSITDINLRRNHIGPEGCEHLSKLLKKNKSIVYLGLKRNKSGDEGCKYLCEGLKVNTTVTHIGLRSNRLTDEACKHISDMLVVNTTLTNLILENNFIKVEGGNYLLEAIRKNNSLTFISLSNNFTLPGNLEAMIQNKVRFNFDQKKLIEEFGETTFSRPKLHFCGPEGCGKTTLRKSLQRTYEESLKINEKVEAEPDKYDQRTQGIEIESGTLRPNNNRRSKASISVANISNLIAPNSNVINNIVNTNNNNNNNVDEEFSFWDFAGQPEYYLTHDMFFSSNESIFLVFCDLSVEKTKRYKDSWYWLKFIKTSVVLSKSDDQENYQAQQKPYVIICGSHRDRSCQEKTGENEVILEQGKWKCNSGDSFVREVKDCFGSYFEIDDRFFVLDCQSSNCYVMEELRLTLRRYHKTISSSPRKVPKICKKVIDLLPLIRQELHQQQKWFYDKTELMKIFIEKISIDQSKLTNKVFLSLLRYLNFIGEVIWFEHNPNLSNTIFIDPQWLCQKIIGKALAPQYFNKHSIYQLSDQNGIITKEDFCQIFEIDIQSKNIQLILLLLESLNLCFQVVHDSENNNINGNNENNEIDGKQKYLIPVLLGNKNIEKNGNIKWENDISNYKYFYGRRFVINNKIDMFPAGFFPKLQVQCDGYFEGSVDLWRNELFGEKFGVQCLLQLNDAEINNNNISETWIDIWVRSSDENSKTKAIIILEKIADLIKTVQGEYSRGLKLTEYVLSCDDLSHSNNLKVFDVYGYKLDSGSQVNYKDNQMVSVIHPQINLQHKKENINDLLGPKIVKEPIQKQNIQQQELKQKEQQQKREKLQQKFSQSSSNDSSFDIKSHRKSKVKNRSDDDDDDDDDDDGYDEDEYREEDDDFIEDDFVTQIGSGMLMFSYNWGTEKNGVYPNQKKVMLIKQKLEERGYKCWIDLDGMGHDMQETMRYVVKNCDAFIACVTNTYQKQHTNANREFLFAVEHKPERVFGLKMYHITDMKNYSYGWYFPSSQYKYYDVSEEDRINIVVDDLVRDLKAKNIFPHS